MEEEGIRVQLIETKIIAGNIYFQRNQKKLNTRRKVYQGFFYKREKTKHIYSPLQCITGYTGPKLM